MKNTPINQKTRLNANTKYFAKVALHILKAVQNAEKIEDLHETGKVLSMKICLTGQMREIPQNQEMRVENREIPEKRSVLTPHLGLGKPDDFDRGFNIGFKQ